MRTLFLMVASMIAGQVLAGWWTAAPAMARVPIQDRQEVEPPPQQDPASDPQEPDQPSNEAYQKFQELVRERQQNQNRIDNLYATMPVGILSRQQEHRAKIEALKSRNREIFGELAGVAREALVEAESPPSDVVGFLFRVVGEKMSGRRADLPYDPAGALELLELMEQSNVQVSALQMYLYRARFLNQQFARAREHLQAAAEAGLNVDPNLVAALEQAASHWEREQQLREAEAAADDLPRVRLQTEVGDITLELFENEAPNTVANFISLVESGFYDETTFYRVIPGTVVQGGCPEGDGSGGAGYSIPSEADGDEIRHHFTGVVGMLTTDRHGVSSQFYITQQPTPQFDGQLTVFGRVIDGLPVVNKIRQVDMTQFSDRKREPTRILKAEVIRKRDHEYVPQKVGESDSNENGTSPDATQDDGEALQLGG